MPDPRSIERDRLLNDLSSSFTPGTRDGVEPPPPPPAIPDHELVRCIGRGSYGEVWLARSILGPWRAVKIVHRRSFDHDRPFERELEGIRKFEPVSRSHPSQLNILHVGRNDTAGCFYYVMELADDVASGLPAPLEDAKSTGPAPRLEGDGRSGTRVTRPSDGVGEPVVDVSAYTPRTLRADLLRRGRLPFEECLQIGLALATALDHLHRHGLVHRDIKPSNIIFVNGIPKLADIGLVAAAEATLSLVGTEGYLPPEGPGTPRADLFSLGKVLYEMATGRDRQEYPELPTRLMEFPLAEREGLAELNEIIVRACHADLRQRYGTAAELHADLALLQSGRSVSRMRAVERRVRILARAGAAVTVVAALAGVAFFYQQEQTREARELARHNRQLAEEKAAIASEKTALADTLAKLAEENRNRIVRLNIASGNRLLDAGDPAGALLWFADALPLLTNHPAEESIHRIRIQQTLDETPRVLQVFPHESAVLSAAFSPDGRVVATGTRNGQLRVWDARVGTLVWGPRSMGADVRFLRFSRDGKRLFASSSEEQWAFNGGVGSPNFHAVLEAESGREIFPSSEAGARISTHLICSHFSSDDRWLATAQHDRRIRVYDLASGRLVAELPGHTDDVRFLSFSADGSLLASASLDRTVRLWRLPSGEAIGPPLVHRLPVVRVLLAGDGRHLLSSSFENPGGFFNAASQAGEGEIQVWDVAGARPVRDPIRGRDWLLMFLDPKSPLRFYAMDHAHDIASPTGPLWKLEAGAVQSWAFSADNQRLAVGDGEHSARVLDTTDGKRVAGPFPHTGEVSAIQFGPDDRFLLTGAQDGTARLWDVRTATAESLRRSLPAPIQRHDAVALASQVGRASGLTPIVLEGDHGVWLFDDRLQPRVRLTTPDAAMRSFGVRGGGRSSVWAARRLEPDSRALVLYRPQGGDAQGVLLEHPDTVAAFVITHDERVVVTSCHDGVIRYWRVSDGGLERSVPIPEGAAGQVHGISPDGRTAIWAPRNLSEQPVFRIVDLESGEFRSASHPLPKGSKLEIRYAPDGAQFAIWDFMGAVSVMETRTGRVISSSIQHSGNLSWIEWDPDCRRLLTAGHNEEVLVWDVQTGSLLAGPLITPGAPTRVARWSPDGRFIVTRSDAGQVRVWDAATGEPVTPLLKHPGEVAIAFLTSFNRLITATYPDLLRAWDLKESLLGYEVLADLAKLLSSRRLGPTGAMVGLKPDELAELAHSLQARAPHLFR